MDAARVPIREEWDWECYQPLPRPLLEPVHGEPKESTCTRSPSRNPAQLRRDDRQPVDGRHRVPRPGARHGAPERGHRRAQGLADGDTVLMESPYGKIRGRVSLSQACIGDGVLSIRSRASPPASQRRAGGGHFNELLRPT